MFSRWKSKKEEKHAETSIEISAPVSGQAVPLSEVPDETFAGGHMGKGIAIEPSEGKLIAPLTAKSLMWSKPITHLSWSIPPVCNC